MAKFLVDEFTFRSLLRYSINYSGECGGQYAEMIEKNIKNAQAILEAGPVTQAYWTKEQCAVIQHEASAMCKKLGVEALDETDEAIKLCAHLWQEYALAKDEELDGVAQQLKKRLLSSFALPSLDMSDGAMEETFKNDTSGFDLSKDENSEYLDLISSSFFEGYKYCWDYLKRKMNENKEG